MVMNTSSTCQMSPSRPCRRRRVKVSDGWLSAGTALGQADVVGAGTNAETSRNALAMLDRQPEQALVELYRLLAVALLHDSTSARVGSLFQPSFKTPRRRISACQARPSG